MRVLQSQGQGGRGATDARADPVPTAERLLGDNANGSRDVCWPRAGAFAAVVKNSVSTLGAERAILTKSSHHEK